MSNWKLIYSYNWNKYFCRFDKSTQAAILNKINQLKSELSTRKLQVIGFNVLEIGQYRVIFRENKITSIRQIIFVGNHKQYEKWYKHYQ